MTNNAGTTFSGQTVAGTGSTITFASVASTHAVQVVVTGYTGSGTAFLNLQASMDGTNWTDLPGAVPLTGNGTFYWTSGSKPMPALYLRGKIQPLPATLTGITVGAICASE